MRLINAQTLQIEDFVGNNVPSYHILSHRWTHDETIYKGFVKGRRKDSLGYRKVVEFCLFVVRVFGETAIRANTQLYVWVDTCCIDKRSSAELSEAINSMWHYYQKSIVCFAYLVGLDDSSNDQAAASERAGRAASGVVTKRYNVWTGDLNAKFPHLSWFTRGFTLQELLAPNTVVFISRGWQVIGRKESEFVAWKIKHGSDLFDREPELNLAIPQITGIPKKFLHSRDEIHQASIAERMSWAAKRETARVEDRAYCLLGIFDVHMPLLYGEGIKAFVRLQKELIQNSSDQSIFAWGLPKKNLPRLIPPGGTHGTTAVLAPDPIYFQQSSGILRAQNVAAATRPYAITNAGLELHAKVRTVHVDLQDRDFPQMPGPRVVYSTALNCVRDEEPNSPLIKIAICGQERKGQGG